MHNLGGWSQTTLVASGSICLVASNQTGKTQLLIPVLPLASGERDLSLSGSVSASVSSSLPWED